MCGDRGCDGRVCATCEWRGAVRAELFSSAAAVIHQGSSGCGASNCAQCSGLCSRMPAAGRPRRQRRIGYGRAARSRPPPANAPPGVVQWRRAVRLWTRQGLARPRWTWPGARPIRRKNDALVKLGDTRLVATAATGSLGWWVRFRVSGWALRSRLAQSRWFAPRCQPGRCTRTTPKRWPLGAGISTHRSGRLKIVVPRSCKRATPASMS